MKKTAITKTTNWKKFVTKRVKLENSKPKEELIHIKPNKTLEYELEELNMKLSKKYDELRLWFAHEEKAIKRRHFVHSHRTSTQNSGVDLLSFSFPHENEESSRVQQKSKVSVLEIEVTNVGVDISSLENGEDSLDMICLIAINNLILDSLEEFEEKDWEGTIREGETCTKTLSGMIENFPLQDIIVKIGIMEEISDVCNIKKYQEVKGDLYEKNNAKARSLKDIFAFTKLKNPNGWAGFLKIDHYGICIFCPSFHKNEDYLWIFDPQGGQEKGKSVLIKFKSESDLFTYIKGRLKKTNISSRTYRMFIFTK